MPTKTNEPRKPRFTLSPDGRLTGPDAIRQGAGIIPAVLASLHADYGTYLGNRQMQRWLSGKHR